MADEPLRNRRIVKRVAVTVTAAILLLGGYISSYLSLFWLVGHGSIHQRTFHPLNQTVFAPLAWYEENHYPGWLYLGRARMHAFWNGQGKQPPPEYWEEIEANWRNAE